MSQVFRYEFVSKGGVQNKQGLSTKVERTAVDDESGLSLVKVGEGMKDLMSSSAVKTGKSAVGLSGSAAPYVAIAVAAAKVIDIVASRQERATGIKEGQLAYNNFKKVLTTNPMSLVLEHWDYGIELALKQKSSDRMSELSSTDVYKDIVGKKR